MDGRTETAQPRADDLVDPEGGGGFAMDFGDEEYAAELDAYPVAATRSAGFEPQQHAEAYANDPWFSSTDSYATNNYVPEEEPAEAAGKEQGQTELDAYKNLHNNAHNSTENTHYGYGANGYTGEGNNVRSPGPVPHPIQHQPIEPFVDRKDSIASITSIPPPKASDNYVPLIPENAAAIPINGGVGVPATYGRRRSSTALSNTVTSPKAQPITLQQAAGHVMFGSNMSIPTIQEAPGSNGISHQQISHSNIQQPASYNSNIIGFGSDQDLSLTHQESWVSTNLVASYKWTIENFHSITDEKIVSPPFGSLDHPWQMVVYPRGAHNDQVYLSAFLRPLKTLPEVTAADDWERSVRRFTMRVHKPASDINGYTLYSSTEPEETFSYTIPPSHQPTGPDGEYVLPDDVLLQDTSLETEFGGFSHSVPGWGFTNLMHLDEFLPVAVDAQSGSLILSASVESTVTVPCHTQSFSWAIPQLAEHTSRSGTLQSPAFGPPACPWTIQLRVDADASLLGGFLQPVLTAGELVYPRWTRAISSFTLKIQSPQGEFGYTHSPAHVNVKTLTGGFVFRDGSESTGWPGLLALDQVSGCADSEGTVRLDVEVTWAGRDVPAVGGDVVVAGAGDVAASGVSEAELARQLQEMELVWDARVRSTELERDSFAGKAASLEEEVIAASDAISKEVERVKQVKAELDASRETESELGSMKLKVSQAKAKIAALRAYFEDGAILRKHQDGLLHVYSPHHKESNMFLLKSQIANLEAELESAREVIRQNHNTMFDMKLFPGSQRPGSPPMGHARRMSVMSESPEGAISVQDALENGRAELENARQSLDDFAHRGDYSPDAGGQLVERSAFRADIGMVFAELSLACASLLDSAYHLEPEQLPTFDRGSTVALLAAEMEELLLSVEAQLSQLRLPFSAYGYATSQSFSPVSASQRLSQSVGREVELQVERLRMQNEMLQEELKGYKRREQNPFDVSDPAFIQSMMSSPTMRQGLTKSVSVSQLAKGRGDVYPEPWTPVDVHGGPVSAVELAKILSQLETSKKQSLFSALFVTAFLLITSFMSYAALNVHCTATLHADSLLCATAVPIAASLSNAWHTAAERFVIDVVPATSGAVGVVQKQALRAMDQRERRVKLERDRMERERVERERLAQVVVEQEEALRLRAAAAEKEQMEKLERWEAEKAAEFAKREREMRERFEAEQVRAKRELEELKVAKEREIQEIRAMALKDREYVPEPNDTVQSDNVSPENADDEVNVRLGEFVSWK
ncbi:hypothetical protein BC830DRAFT_503420 [Chytriomyces sp. MP71]|nr:hypothetical protein BC830DRAFT_503420 [Chytriomyces sp. MP71]